ncbi:low temperature requirement protein A [Fibrella arboris]|uniref:low temperature requirement protein A n=1 Tax=Fibrella arboris TaxID=3242486 RepID=UPI003521E305
MAEQTEEKRNVPQLRTAEKRGERRTTWAELLNDLAYTTIVMQLAMRLNKAFSLEDLLDFLLLYVPVWWLWNGQAHYATRFDNTNDSVHRFLGSAQLIGLIILAASIHKATTELSVVYALAYASVRLILLIDYGRAWYYIPQARPYTRVILIGFAISVLIWVGSLGVKPPYRYGLWAVALLIELTTPLTSGGKLHVQFPPDVRHLPERYGLFTLLVLGQAVSGLSMGLMNSPFTPAAITSTVLGGVVIIGLWWAYFDRLDDDAVRKLAEHGHKTKKAAQSSVRQYTIWLYTHLPLTVALTLSGVGLTHAIKAVNEAALTVEQRWLLVGTVVTYLAAEAVISLTTLNSGPAHVSFRRGVIGRVGAAGVLVLVGLFTRLGTLTMLFILAAVVTALILSDQLSPEAPDSTERVKEGVGN